MRVREGAKRLTVLAAMSTLILGVGLSVWSDSGNSPSTKATAQLPAWVSVNPPSGTGPKLKVETKRQLGLFGLSKGRKLSISTADTVDGKACLIEEDEDGAGSSCLDGGFFALRKVEFLVSSQGGPEQFTALHVAGVVAPSIRAASLVKTDGTAVQLRLNSERAFVYESPSSELEARIHPTALRLYGANRKLAETVTFPPAG